MSVLSGVVFTNARCTSQDRILQFVVGFAFENEGGGRNDSTGAASAVGGGGNVRTDVFFPFPTYVTKEAFARTYEVVRGSMDTLFNFIL